MPSHLLPLVQQFSDFHPQANSLSFQISNLQMKRLIRKKGMEKILVHVKALNDEKEADKQPADKQQND